MWVLAQRPWLSQLHDAEWRCGGTYTNTGPSAYASASASASAICTVLAGDREHMRS